MNFNLNNFFYKKNETHNLDTNCTLNTIIIEFILTILKSNISYEFIQKGTDING